MTEEKTNIAKLSRESGINYNTVKDRLKRGMSLEEALSKPIKDNTDSMAQIARDNNINIGTLRDRINKQGMTLEEALKTPLKQGYKHLWQNKKEEMIEKQNRGKAKILKKYVAIDPEGNTTIIENLKEFCRKNNWNYNSVTTQMTRRNGWYKDWLIRVKNND